MNKHIRRVAIAVGVLMVALFLNLNFVQVVQGRRLSEQFGESPGNPHRVRVAARPDRGGRQGGSRVGRDE